MKYTAILSLALFVSFSSSVVLGQTQQDQTQTEPKAKMFKSVLLQPWTGPHGGVPPWKQVKPNEFVDAFDAAIEISKREITDIANQESVPSFDNTIIALEKAGKTLNRLQTIFGVHSSNLNVGPISDIEKAVAPKLSKHGDWITQNDPLFKRIEAVYESDEFKQLNLAQRRLVEDYYKNFVRQGAKLDAEQKQKLSEINTQLAGLFTQFSQNVLKDEGERGDLDQREI